MDFEKDDMNEALETESNDGNDVLKVDDTGINNEEGLEVSENTEATDEYTENGNEPMAFSRYLYDIDETEEDIDEELVDDDGKSKKPIRMLRVLIGCMFIVTVLIVMALILWNPDNSRGPGEIATPSEVQESTPSDASKHNPKEEFDKVLEGLREKDYVAGYSYVVDSMERPKEDNPEEIETITGMKAVQWYIVNNTNNSVIGYSEANGKIDEQEVELKEVYRYLMNGSDGHWTFESAVYDDSESKMTGEFEATKKQKYTGTDLILADLTYLEIADEYETDENKDGIEFISHIKGKHSVTGIEYNIYLADDYKILSIEYLDTENKAEDSGLNGGVYRFSYPGDSNYNVTVKSITDVVSKHGNILQKEEDEFKELIGKKVVDIEGKKFKVDYAGNEDTGYELGQTQNVKVEHIESGIQKEVVAVSTSEGIVGVKELTVLDIN